MIAVQDFAETAVQDFADFYEEVFEVEQSKFWTIFGDAAQQICHPEFHLTKLGFCNILPCFATSEISFEKLLMGAQSGGCKRLQEVEPFVNLKGLGNFSSERLTFPEQRNDGLLSPDFEKTDERPNRGGYLMYYPRHGDGFGPDDIHRGRTFQSLTLSHFVYMTLHEYLVFRAWYLWAEGIAIDFADVERCTILCTTYNDGKSESYKQRNWPVRAWSAGERLVLDSTFRELSVPLSGPREVCIVNI